VLVQPAPDSSARAAGSSGAGQPSADEAAVLSTARAKAGPKGQGRGPPAGKTRGTPCSRPRTTRARPQPCSHHCLRLRHAREIHPPSRPSHGDRRLRGAGTSDPLEVASHTVPGSRRRRRRSDSRSRSRRRRGSRSYNGSRSPVDRERSPTRDRSRALATAGPQAHVAGQQLPRDPFSCEVNGRGRRSSQGNVCQPWGGAPVGAHSADLIDPPSKLSGLGSLAAAAEGRGQRAGGAAWAAAAPSALQILRERLAAGLCCRSAFSGGGCGRPGREAELLPGGLSKAAPWTAVRVLHRFAHASSSVQVAGPAPFCCRIACLLASWCFALCPRVHAARAHSDRLVQDALRREPACPLRCRSRRFSGRSHTTRSAGRPGSLALVPWGQPTAPCLAAAPAGRTVPLRLDEGCHLCACRSRVCPAQLCSIPLSGPHALSAPDPSPAGWMPRLWTASPWTKMVRPSGVACGPWPCGFLRSACPVLRQFCGGPTRSCVR
jgi:hypothetical protein